MRAIPALLSLLVITGIGCGDSHSAVPSGAGGSVAGNAPSPEGGAATTGGVVGTGGVPTTGGVAVAAAGDSATGGAAATQSLSVLLFSKTTGYRHESIPVALVALLNAGSAAGWTMSATEDASVFVDDQLNQLDVVVFVSTTGDILDDSQQAAFERFIRSGKGFVGIHSATDTEYDWSFYGGLVGAYFREHPAIQRATVHVEAATDPTMSGIPTDWSRTDEWYAFKDNPRPNVNVLMTLLESSYSPGTSAMGDDHPITWSHEYEGGRAFYTALGHTNESYADPIFIGMLTRAIAWAGGG